MFNAKAEGMNRKAQGYDSQPDKVLDALKIEEGETVMDLGAGGGYFSIRLSEEVGDKGRVYAVETNDDMLEYMDNYLNLLQKSNVETVRTRGGVPDIPDESCDLIFARNVFHHLDNPTLFFLALGNKLKPTGRIAILDYKPTGGFSFISLFKHHIEENIILESMESAGFKPLQSFDFLKKQSFTIFERKTDH
ncbi:class I SAM-dependent methyltransferase [Fusibacter sp. JL216-2]|uniref:class I SAM-dependent methyltransferase n=1 Tax=Fusibacter sp. JL216-2 TaxID=3071453 RepID=UPI003D35561F